MSESVLDDEETLRHIIGCFRLLMEEDDPIVLQQRFESHIRNLEAQVESLEGGDNG